jgi:8-oxo-dGTP pyrophosphatase MutT (NUDIX family)
MSYGRCDRKKNRAEKCEEIQQKNQFMNELHSIIAELLRKPLPGMEAQLKMAPSARIRELFSSHTEKQPVMSSVLIPIYLKGGVIHTLFIRRPDYPGIHGGQMAFPGGRSEPFDVDHMGTAIRETEEEIGVERDLIQIAGALTPLYIPPSNYMVYPFVGIIPSEPVFTPDPSEVAEVVEIPLQDLLKPGSTQTLAPSPEFHFMEVPAFVIGSNVIWGATAMITAELIALIKSNRLEMKLMDVVF